jgi:cysteine desulfurase/selenocysteine lyase
MTSPAQLDPSAVRADFPIFAQERDGPPLAFLDNAATSQKPRHVLGAMAGFYERHNANVHRAVYRLSEEATAAYEGARDRVASFIRAPDRRGVVFTRNTTEAINLVAYAWGRANVEVGDRIVVTEMEHHSNLLPWRMLAKERGADLATVQVTSDGELDLDSLNRHLAGPVKLVAFAHVSNVLGTINPAREIVARAHEAGALVLVDAAQSVPHMPVDVTALDCDFLAFSSHKMCGPTGAGVLYGRPALLEEMPPFLVGGGMIRSVDAAGARWNDVPWKFEAGTSAIAEVVGLSAAVDYLTSLGMHKIWTHERLLSAYALERLADVSGLRLFGPPADRRTGVIAFAVEGIHPHDLAHVLDQRGIAIRAGFHCAQPIHARFGIQATARASFYLYNTLDEVDRLLEGIRTAQQWFGALSDG